MGAAEKAKKAESGCLKMKSGRVKMNVKMSAKM
jgi:hypothetical protein